MARFDLHLHSNNSDGSATVKELVDTVTNSGIKIFALTDHDTVNGVNEVEQYISENTPPQPSPAGEGATLTSPQTSISEMEKTFTLSQPSAEGIIFIKGVELTCKIDNINCHILGYRINPNSKELTDLIELGKKLRRQKLETRIKYLKDVWSIELTKEELDWLYSRPSVVKTHLANILVNRGLADDNVSAMKKYLDECKTGNTKFDGEVAIQTIKKAGGIPVWAHPLGGEGEEHLSKEEFLPKLETMIECGIQGLECYYSRYSMFEIEFLINCAHKYNLLISGGSDWHGTNKTVPIGRLNIDNIEIDSDKINILQDIYQSPIEKHMF